MRPVGRTAAQLDTRHASIEEGATDMRKRESRRESRSSLTQAEDIEEVCASLIPEGTQEEIDRA